MSRGHSQHLFSQVPRANIQRSKFNRSHGYKTTFNEGVLVPIMIDEVLPGDTFDLTATLFCRVATLINPIMDNMYLDTFFFFVPNRLVWDNWQRFCGEQDNPDDSTDFLIPTATADIEAESLGDYLGLPIANNVSYNVLPFRCMALIWNEWFRDENLQDSIPLVKDDTGNWYNASASQVSDGKVNGFDLNKPFPRGKRHDYFTSCLPWPQKGPAVDLPIGTSAPVSSSDSVYVMGVKTNNGIASLGLQPFYVDSYFAGSVVGDESSVGTYIGNDVASNPSLDHARVFGFGSGYSGIEGQQGLNFSGGDTVGVYDVSTGTLTADLSQAAAVTINALREAFQIQKWYERAARGGTRYTEIILSFFGVRSPDARLQRPEYLGGTSQRLDVSTVPQTSATDSNSPQANLAAFGLVASKRHGFTKSFTEHGYILGFCCIRADLNYQQGLHRMWSRQTKFDLYWPTFAHLGEQEVLNKEIYYQGNSQDDDVFGYQERYAEYRYFPSQITGQFRSSFAQSLDSWHLAQYFENLPTLSSEFIVEQPPVDRVVAVQNYPHFLLDCYFDMKCIRPMPLYGTPELVDHF